MFVGFHSRAGTPKGLLAHTWASAVVHELRLNGREVGETAINAAILGDAGVPVTLVCGGDDLAREALADLGSVETAIVKQVHGFDLASCWGPKRTLPLLREAAARAVTRHREGAFEPFIIEGPVVAEVTVLKDSMAERMSLVPGVERTARRTIRVGGATATEALSGAWRAIQEVFHEPAGWLR
jgi:D-amino peptidase